MWTSSYKKGNKKIMNHSSWTVRMNMQVSAWTIAQPFVFLKTSVLGTPDRSMISNDMAGM